MPTIEATPGGRVYAAPGSGIDDWSYGIALARLWPKADEYYDAIKDATGVDIYEVCSRPKDEAITDPAITQPAAYGIGYASAQFLKQEIGPPNYLMGLSAAEFTVTAIGGAIDLKEGAVLSQKRGQYQREVAGGKGGSAIVLLHDRLDQSKRRRQRIHQALANHPGIHISNHHTPLKIGIGFKAEAFRGGKLLDELKTIQGVRRALHNKNVEFAPHGEDLKEAQDQLAALMDKTAKIKDATVPILANLTGRLMKKSGTIKNNLIWQTTSPTQLGRGMAYLIDKGVMEYWDIGPDKAMKKLLGDYATLFNVEIKSAAEYLDDSLQ